MEIEGYKIERIDVRNIAVGKMSKSGRVSAPLYFSNLIDALKWIRKQLLNEKSNYFKTIDGVLNAVIELDKLFEERCNEILSDKYLVDSNLADEFDEFLKSKRSRKRSEK